jgi:SAM-dependent methyltransferase
VLDIGCFDGSLFATYRARIAHGVGIDPILVTTGDRGGFRFIKAPFPSSVLDGQRFDVITMLAVLEHVPADELEPWREACEELLEPGGRIIATVPSPRVDDILHLLGRVHLIEGIAAHEHHGFDPSDVPRIFSSGGLTVAVHRRFELGLNHLFVFTKAGG